MRKITSLFIFLLFFAAANAQFKQLAEGPVFKEPEEGFARIIQMKNGSTAFIVINVKNGIDVRLYNAIHTEIAVKDVQPAYGKLNHGSIEGAFEINGDVVLMISEVESRTPMLYRVIIDGKTGEIKDDQKIAQLDKVTFGEGYAMAFGGVPMPNFFIRKDPSSDNYALVMFNSFESDRSKRIEIVTYGPDNKEVNRAYYSSPEEKYKYLRYVDMAVLGSDKVCVLAYGYNTKNSGGKESELILANLDKGAKTVSFTGLDFSKDLLVYQGLTKYDPVTKLLVLIALTKTESRDKGYSPYLAMVDPFQRKLIASGTIQPSDKVINYSDKQFEGLPQDLFINDDGGFTIVYEEMTITSRQSGYASSVSTELGRNAVVNYNKQGQITSDYLIRKSHTLWGAYMNPFYHSERDLTAMELYKGNQYKSFAYLNGKSQSFLLFNDTQRNDKSQQQDGKTVSVSGVSESDAYYYPLTGTDVVPKRDFVFGDPGKHDHNLALFAVSDYDKINNIYVTLKLENASGKKGVKVVWLQP